VTVKLLVQAEKYSLLLLKGCSGGWGFGGRAKAQQRGRKRKEILKLQYCAKFLSYPSFLYILLPRR